MSDKRYPTRMHEVLGVETGERFRLKNNPHGNEWFVSENGMMIMDCEDGVARSGVHNVFSAINHGIIRRPRYTPKQAEVLKALKVIGYADGFLTKDSDGTVFAHTTKPYKGCEEWLGSKTYSFIPGNIGLVSWDDDEPLSIAQALLDAGEEGEG